MSESERPHQSFDQPEPISYEQFGENFFELAVTDARIKAVVAAMVSKPIDVGPIQAGPGRLVKVAATGSYGTAVITRTGSHPVEFRLDIPATVDFVIHLPLDAQHFTADIVVPLILRATPVAPLRILIDVIPPQARDLSINVKAGGLRAAVVQKVADVDAELRRFLARYVGREVTKPYVHDASLIDIAALMENAWPAGADHVDAQP